MGTCCASSQDEFAKELAGANSDKATQSHSLYTFAKPNSSFQAEPDKNILFSFKSPEPPPN